MVCSHLLSILYIVSIVYMHIMLYFKVKEKIIKCYKFNHVKCMMCVLWEKNDWKDIEQNVSSDHLLWMVGLCILCVISTLFFCDLLFIKKQSTCISFLAVTTYFHLGK